MQPGAGQQQWANPAAAAQLQGMQQQRTVSPLPGQQGANAQVQQQQLFQQLLKSGQIAPNANGQWVMANPTLQGISSLQAAGVNPMQLQALYQQQQLQQQLQLQQQQQQQQQHTGGAAGQRRAGSAGAPPAAPKKAGSGSSMSSAGSGSNLAALTAQQQQSAQLQQQLMAQQAAAAARVGRPPGSGMLQMGMGPGGLRAGSAPGQLGGVRPLGLSGLPGGSASASLALHAHAHLASLRAGEAPRVEPLPGTEWVQCMSRDGNPGWYAVPREKAAAMRAAAAKRRAEEGSAGGPPSKLQAGVGGARRRMDDDVTAGASMNVLDVMGADDLQAEYALNEAAKGAVVVEQGNVQEEYLLSPGPTMALVARAAKNSGVRAVGEDVYAFLSLAAEAHLTQLLHSLVRSRLQREDLGKGYNGVERLDDRLRTGLFQIQKREKEAARKREEEQRDELAKLGTSRKKLAEEDKKAAKAAQSARQLEQQQKNLGSTLTKMGIGRRTFAMSALGRPAGAAAAKSGFTKPELLEAKAAAAANGAAASSGDDSSAGAAAIKPELDPAAAAAMPVGSVPQAASAGGAGGAAAAAASLTGSGSAAPGVPPVKPVTLQHHLLNAANSAEANKQLGGAVPAFVAGGASATREKDGEEGLREVMLADLIAVLERHPLYCRSQQLYILHALAGQPINRDKPAAG